MNIHFSRVNTKLAIFTTVTLLTLPSWPLTPGSSSLTKVHAGTSPVIITVSSQQTGTSQLANGVTFENNNLDSGDAAAIAQAKQYLSTAVTYENQFTYGWGTNNPEPMQGVFNWASLDRRVQLMEATHASGVLTLVSAPDWMNYLNTSNNTNTISGVSTTGSPITVRLGTTLSSMKGGTSIIGGETILVDSGANQEQIWVTAVTSYNGTVTGFTATFKKSHPSDTRITWGFSDFKGYPPAEAHFQDFADMAVAMARRYSVPDPTTGLNSIGTQPVLHYQVWSELREFWVNSSCQYQDQGLRLSPYCASNPGIRSNWDYVAYTKLYNVVYDALKQVNQNIKVGGPYIPIKEHPQSGPLTLSTWESAVIKYWLQNAHGADFLDFDHSIVDYNAPDAGNIPPDNWTLTQILSQTATAEDITNQVRQLTNGTDVPSWTKDLPIWWAEDYFDARTARLVYAPEAFQAVAMSSLLLHEIRTGAAAELRWKAQTNAGLGYNGEQESLFSDVQDAINPGRLYPYAADFQMIHSYFGPGTRLYQATSSSTSIEVLAATRSTMILNKTTNSVPVLVNGTPYTLQPFQVLFLDTPGLMQVLTPTATRTPQPTVTPTSTQVVASNLIQNASFENTGSNWLSPWQFTVKSGAAAVLSQEGTSAVAGTKSAKVSVTTANLNPYYVQLRQNNLVLNPGIHYVISFWARASTTRPLQVTLQNNQTFATVASVNPLVTTSWQQFSFSFTPSSSLTALLAFNCAQASGQVWIDNVKLQSQ
jgi:hypothetical protein